MLQFYRGHIVSVIKNGRAALDTRWRGSYQLLCAVIRLVIHMCALEERMLGPRYDVLRSVACVSEPHSSAVYVIPYI